jgi:hypothetical protein
MDAGIHALGAIRCQKNRTATSRAGEMRRAFPGNRAGAGRAGDGDRAGTMDHLVLLVTTTGIRR